MKNSHPRARRTRGLLAGLTAAALAIGGVATSGAPALADELAPTPTVVEQPLTQSAEAASGQPADAAEGEAASPGTQTPAPAGENETPPDAAASAVAPSPASTAAPAPAPVAPLTAAAAPAIATPTVTVTDAPNAGGQVTITGSGFAATSTGIYVGLGPVGLPGFYLGASKLVSTTWVAVGQTAGGSGMGATAPLDADGTFTLTLDVPAPSVTAPAYAIYTSKAHGQGMSDSSQNTTTAIAYTPAPVPTVTVSKATGLDPAGDTVTVTGSGFLPHPPATSGTRPPLADTFGGAYVVFGRFADVWKPSAGAGSASRPAISTFWGVHAADIPTIGGPARGAIEITADGTFSVEVPVTAAGATATKTGNYGIYTYPGGGASYAEFETYTPLGFTAPEVPTTTTLSASSAAVTAGSTVTLAASVTPSSAAGAITFYEGDAAIGAPVPVVSGSAQSPVVLTTAGTARLTARFAPASGFGASTSPVVSVTVSSVIAPPVVAPVAAGSLTWGIDAGFRSYITGPIAAGTIAVGGGATSSTSGFNFGQSGGSFDHSSGTGTGDFTGTVRFTGHGGALDLTFSNPSVRLTSSTAGTLSVTVNGSRIDFATLDLASASRSNANGATTLAGVPATLTAAGATAFQGFYAAGRALAPVTVTIGGNGAAPAGSRGTVATASATTVKSASTVPSSPPATTGIELDAAALKTLVSGGGITLRVGGFQPNETGILVVVYSTPTVLARGLTADADGVVTWTGSLPAGLAAGEHTLTVQGSVSKGIVFTLPERAGTAAGICTVDGASLDWGFKESFRSYLTSGIAHGQWELSGPSEREGIFSWAAGSGTLDPKTERGVVGFTGGIRFTGHDGALDTTIANPRIELSGTDEAHLLLDVTGTTQQGEPVSTAAVRFATLDLTGGTVERGDSALVGTAVPAALTEEGAAAFGTYPAGDELDPVSFRVPLAAGCGVAVSAAVEEASAEAVTATGASTDDAEAVSWWVWALAALLAAGAVLAVVVVTRRGRGAGAAAE